MSGDDNRNGDTMPSLVRSAHEFTNIDFDYLIIGGGTAGLVIAARLTEDHTVTVGVLEAGQNRLSDPVVDTPAMFPLTLRNDDYDWAFTTEPQVHNRGVRHHVPRGRLLGGSSGINYMMYVRGSLQDYDDWATISGDPTWGSKSMKEYMKKHQTFEPHNENLSQSTTTPLICDNHGTSGPIHTTFNESLLPIERDFEDACNEVTGFCKKPSDPYVQKISLCLRRGLTLFPDGLVTTSDFSILLVAFPEQALIKGSVAMLHVDTLSETPEGLISVFCAKLGYTLLFWILKIER